MSSREGKRLPADLPACLPGSWIDCLLQAGETKNTETEFETRHDGWINDWRVAIRTCSSPAFVFRKEETIPSGVCVGRLTAGDHSSGSCSQSTDGLAMPAYLIDQGRSSLILSFNARARLELHFFSCHSSLLRLSSEACAGRQNTRPLSLARCLMCWYGGCGYPSGSAVSRQLLRF